MKRYLSLAVVLLLTACAGTPQRKAFTTIDDATRTVQAAASAYKRHCGVPKGADGPGTCDATEYLKSEAVYAQFQKTNDGAIEIAQRTGQTPLQVVTAAAAIALATYDSLR